MSPVVRKRAPLDVGNRAVARSGHRASQANLAHTHAGRATRRGVRKQGEWRIEFVRASADEVVGPKLPLAPRAALVIVPTAGRLAGRG